MMPKMLSLSILTLSGLLLSTSSSFPSSNGDINKIKIISNKGGMLQKILSTEEDQYHQLRSISPISPLKRNTGHLTFYTNTKSFLKKTFLPSSAKKKIPREYFLYCLYSSLQDLSTQIRSVLATQRILEGVGVGRQGATALSASLNFIVRDGVGMIASLAFTSLKGSKFGDTKRWRIFADLAIDLGITLETAATLVPSFLFLPMICLGNLFKAMCGVAAGAVGGSISLHWAEILSSDISDVNAKFGAQNTVTGALGLIFAAIFAQSVSGVSIQKLWVVFSVLTITHILSNVTCMKLLTLNYFNSSRFRMVAIPFISQYWESLQQNPNRENDTIEIHSPSTISTKEPLFFFPVYDFKTLFSRKHRVEKQKFPTKTPYPIKIGSSIEDLIKNCPQINVNSLLDEFVSDQHQIGHIIYGRSHIVKTGIVGKSSGRKRRCMIYVALKSNIQHEEKIRAYFHALLLSNALQRNGIPSSFSYNSTDYTQDKLELERTIDQIEKDVSNQLESMWNVFVKKCEMYGWSFSKSIFECSCGYDFNFVHDNDLN